MGYLPSLIGRLRVQMEKRPVDLGTRDSALVLGIFAISASVLIVVLVVSGANPIR